ncbi:MAG: SpoIIE family protein phosphatase [Chloroflexi bacterium]|nr:SpoIIE family protein phosphatase [Chloroflexota bacterium]
MTQPNADRLVLLYRISQSFNSSLDLDEVLEHVMDEVVASTKAERGFLMLRAPDGALEFRAARGLDKRKIDGPEFHISRGVVERVAREGQPILTHDAQTDPRLSAHSSVLNLRLRSILCVPLQLKDKTLGVVYVDNRIQAGLFMQDDLELLTSIAASAAVAIENARLYQVAVEKGRLERELQVARQVQASLLPKDTPHIAGWDFAARWLPAREVAGDYYDFSFGSPPDLDLVVGDVTDKGMPAALFMAVSRSVVRASLIGAASLAHGITQANRLISGDSTNGMFITLFCGRLDPASGVLTYVNAGHNPPLLYRAADDSLTELGRTGMALGVDDAHEYRQEVARLDPGDFVFLYTDGVTDAPNDQDECFDMDRLRALMHAHGSGSAAQIASAVEDALREFTHDAPPFDDITLMVAKRL